MTYYKGSVDKNLVRGDDRTFNLTVRVPAIDGNSSPTPVDLTGGIVTFTMKRWRDLGEPVVQDDPIVRKSSDDTSEVMIQDQTQDASKGKASIVLRGDDTKFLEPGIYVYDVQFRTGSNLTYTVARGRILLQGDVTSAEDETTP